MVPLRPPKVFSARARFTDEARVAARPGRPPKYLLSQLGKCGGPGGPISVANGRSGKTTIKVDGCNWHRTRGTCPNSLRRPVEAVNAAAVDWVAAHVLTEQVVLQVLGEIDARLRAQSDVGRGEVASKQKDIATLKAEIDRLVLAIATTQSAPEAVVHAITERQERLNALEADLRAAQRAPALVALNPRDSSTRVRVSSVLRSGGRSTSSQPLPADHAA